MKTLDGIRLGKKKAYCAEQQLLVFANQIQKRYFSRNLEKFF